MVKQKFSQRKMKTLLATPIPVSTGGAAKAQAGLSILVSRDASIKAPVGIECKTGGSGSSSAANPVSASYSTVKTAFADTATLCGGNQPMKIAVAGGGTAGHANIGLEIPRANRERGGRGIYLGGDSGYESRLVPRAGEQLEIIPAKPFALRSAGRKLAAVATIAASVRASRRVLLRERVHLVAGTRSYGVLKQFRDFG